MRFRRLMCSLFGHVWNISYPEGSPGPRIADCVRCHKRSVRL